jgi:hypothetical protein
LSPSIPRGQRQQAGESHPKTGVSQADCNDCCFHDPLPLNGLGFDLTLRQDCFQCDFLNLGAAGFYSPFRFCTRICKPLRFWRVLSFWQIGPPPQPLLWKCGNPRSVRVSKLRGQLEDLRVSIRLFRPRSVISTASPWFRGISDRMYLRASNSAQMHAFQKAA